MHKPIYDNKGRDVSTCQVVDIVPHVRVYKIARGDYAVCFDDGAVFADGSPARLADGGTVKNVWNLKLAKRAANVMSWSLSQTPPSKSKTRANRRSFELRNLEFEAREAGTTVAELLLT